MRLIYSVTAECQPALGTSSSAASATNGTIFNCVRKQRKKNKGKDGGTARTDDMAHTYIINIIINNSLKQSGLP